MDWEDLGRRPAPEPAPERWKALERRLGPRAEASALRIRRARMGRWAAAAAVLLGLAWLAPRKPLQAPPAATRQDAVYLAPDCCLIPAKGARLVREGERLRLESGALEWVNRGWTTVRLETPFGTLKGETAEATVSLSCGARTASWIRDALAFEPALTVEVRDGSLSFGSVEIPAGRAATFSDGREVLWRDVPRREPPSRWTGQVSGRPGFLPVPSTAWEIEVRALSPSTSLGLALPAEGGIRMWHLQDAGGGRWMRLRIAARGDWMEGWADGRRLVSTTRASRQLQGAPGEGPGLYVWGKAEVR